MTSQPIFIFQSQTLACGTFNFVIVRECNHYYLAFNVGYYGHCATRMHAHFNPTTAEEKPRRLPNGHPCIWLEPSDPSSHSFTVGKELDELIGQLLEAQPRAPIHLTGRKRGMRKTDRDGVERRHDALEIMMLLTEDELAHCCYYCGWPEVAYGDDKDGRYPRIGGDGYESTYACWDVSKVSS